MIRSKKISCDFLHLALILAVIRLGPEILLGSHWQEPLEVGDAFLGPTLAYRHFYAHNSYSRPGRYVRLKSLDSVMSNDIVSFQNWPYFLSNNAALRSNIIAYYSDNQNSLSSSDEQHGEEHSRGDNTNSDTSEIDHTNEAQAEVSILHQLENSSLDLSPEDMDLIEILWKQDIDLGVSRDAFNIHESHELEKAKAEPEIAIKTDHMKEPNSDIVCKHEKEDAALKNNTASFIYVIDSETGEHVIQEPKAEGAKSSLPFEESLLSFEGFEEFTNILAEENCSDAALGRELLLEGDELSQILDEFDPDILNSELEKLDSASPVTTQIDDLDLAGEMYPSMEEYWQDISTTLPLSVMNQTCILPRPSRPFSEASDDHSGASAYSDQPRPTPSDQVFTDAFPQNSGLPPRIAEMNNNFTYLSPLLGPTSLGCAVASSIATLTNDTDPMPDMTAPMNATFGFDMPGMLPINQTTSQAANEAMLSELLLDDDLQLMDVASASPYPAEGTHRAVPFMRIFEQDPNSSDTVSSLDYDENGRTKLEELPSSCGSKEVIYGAFKYQSNHAPLSCGIHPDTSSNNPNYAVGLHTSFRGNYSLQHNHTYHLPFSSGNNLPKPLSRDRLRQLSCDNESNSRDEKRAKALELPISINDIINLAIDEFNEKLTKFELTEPQMTLIRDIRRRGKNKVAAQNCRKRKMDQISNLQQDLCVLHDERLQLESERTRLLHQRRNIRDKYSKLCQLVVQSSSSPVPTISDFSPPDQSSNCSSNNNNSITCTDTDLTESDSDMMYNQGVRAKKKIAKKS